MKKFLAIMMIFITVLGSGFAAEKANPANATLEFTFEWSGLAGEAKNFAGFYDSFLPGAGDTPAGSHANLEALDGKATIVGPIAIDKSTKTWAPNTIIYAAAGTNWITTATKVEITLDAFRSEGGVSLGYSVDCTKTAATTAAVKFLLGGDNNGGSGHFNTKETITVPVSASKKITTDIQATKGGDADPAAPQYAKGTNGIVELKFENMKVTVDPIEGNLYLPTEGVEANQIKNYKATWTFSVAAQ